MFTYLSPQSGPRAVPQCRSRQYAAIAAALALIAGMPLAGPPAAAAPVPAGTRPGRITAVVVEPDEAGARVVVALDAPFHYTVDRRPDRVLIILDPVSAAAADHALTAGPVRNVRIRSLSGTPPRAVITVFTSEPVAAAGSSLDGHALTVSLKVGPGATVSEGSRAGSAGRTSQAEGGGTAAPGPPRAGPRAVTDAGAPGLDHAVVLEESTGRLLDVPHLVRVAVSDPRIAGVVPISGRQVLLTGRAAGRTSLYVWDGTGRVVSYDVEVRPAQDAFAELRRALAALLPDASITVTEAHGGQPGASVPPAAGSAGVPPAAVPPAGMRPGAVPPVVAPPFLYGRAAPDNLPPAAQTPPGSAATESRAAVLSGSVQTQADRAKAEAIARAFVAQVVDLLAIRHPVQFTLGVEVVELNRNAQETLGITWGGGQQVPGSPPSLNGGVYNLQILTAPGLAANGLDLLIAQLEALSQRGQARLLARPSLAVMAGRTASLLLGGQVPVPVAGANGTVTVEYKDFGVILAARPEYQDDGRLFLEITPEVSTLDFTDAVKVGGFEIPALRVRRAQTMVAMRPGETLVLGGLLQREDAASVQKIPLLGDLPVIGPLFRSRSFQRQESDLLILVTPRLIEPSQAP
jgi:Flp pilus assembly secretin CpaC